MMSEIAEVKTGLEHHREDTKINLQEAEKELRSVEESIRQAEVEEATEKTEVYIKTKKGLYDRKWALEQKIKQFKTQLLDIDKMLQTTDGMISGMVKHFRRKPDESGDTRDTSSASSPY